MHRLATVLTCLVLAAAGFTASTTPAHTAEADRLGVAKADPPAGLVKAGKNLARLVRKGKFDKARKYATRQVIRELRHPEEGATLSGHELPDCRKRAHEGNDFFYSGPKPWGCSGYASYTSPGYEAGALIGVGFKKVDGKWIGQDFQLIYVD